MNPIQVAIERVGGIIEVSALLKVSNGTVQYWKNEGRMPNDTQKARERVAVLAHASGVSPLELLGFRVEGGRSGSRVVAVEGGPELAAPLSSAPPAAEAPQAPQAKRPARRLRDSSRITQSRAGMLVVGAVQLVFPTLAPAARATSQPAANPYAKAA